MPTGATYQNLVADQSRSDATGEETLRSARGAISGTSRELNAGQRRILAGSGLGSCPGRPRALIARGASIDVSEDVAQETLARLIAITRDNEVGILFALGFRIAENLLADSLFLFSWR